MISDHVKRGRQPKNACMQGKGGFVSTLYGAFVIICLATVIIVTLFTPRVIKESERHQTIKSSAETPVKSSVETPVKSSVETPVKSSVETPAATAPKKSEPPVKKIQRARTTKFSELPEKFMKNVTVPNNVNFTLLPWSYAMPGQRHQDRYFVTFLVKSAARFVSRRFLLRRTWGSIAQINGKRFGLIFMVGKMPTEKEQAMLQEENDLYGDILQSTVLDGYHYLPEKVLAGFKYLLTEAGDITDFIITTDDDCYVNIHIVYDYFATDSEQKHDAIHCGFVYDVDAPAVRDPESKWRMDPSIYPNMYYPPFCHGGMIVMSYFHIQGLYANSLTTNRTGVYLEDVLIFGILREKTLNPRFRVVPYGYNGAVGKSFGHEQLVFHLDHGPMLHHRMFKRWMHSLKYLHFSNTKSVASLSEQFLASVRAFPTLFGKTVTETTTYFTDFWGDS